MQFSVGDYVEMNLNIFTEKGLLDTQLFVWQPIKVNPTSEINFLEFCNEHNKRREIVDFELGRFCELEILKNKWTDLVNMTNHENVLNKIKILFEPHLIVTKVFYDNVGYYLFKIYLLANEEGKAYGLNLRNNNK